MRVYIRTTWKNALVILAEGFFDLHADLGDVGVWCDDHPRGCERAAGDTVLCVDVPADLFRERKVHEGTRGLAAEEPFTTPSTASEPGNVTFGRLGYAIIPAATLNQFGRPQVYDHEYAGNSRVELIKAIRTWEQRAQAASDPAGIHEHVRGMREAIEFFDTIGWRTPLRLIEEAPDAVKPGPWLSAEIQEE